MLELITAALLKDTKDLSVSVIPYVSSRDQKILQNLIPAKENPFSKSECLKVVESIENSIYGRRLPTDTYSDVTLNLFDSLVRRNRQTTIVTLAGTVSNGDFQDSSSPYYTPGNIATSISKITSTVGRSSLVKYFAAGFYGTGIRNNPTKMINYETEITLLAAGNLDRAIMDSNQVRLFRKLLQRLRNEGVFCDIQSKYTTFSARNNFYFLLWNSFY